MEYRYAALGLGGGLRRRCEYAEACWELVKLVEDVYSLANKPLQARIIQDALDAMRILPEMRSSADFAAALALAQACEAKLPRQRKCSVASEYRHAAIKWQRGLKRQSEGGQACWQQLPPDLLLHVFGFLDAFSLGVAACVCRSWSDAAKEDGLWRKQLLSGFGNTVIDARVLRQAGFEFTCKGRLSSCRLREVSVEKEGCWRDAFHLAVKYWPKSLRVYKRSHCITCRTTFWPSQLTAQCPRSSTGHRLAPLQPSQVVSYVLLGSTAPFPECRGNDSDSDTDMELPNSKLWAYARSWQT